MQGERRGKYIRSSFLNLRTKYILPYDFVRCTFATTIILSNVVSIETVSRTLGHTKLGTTQVYAKVLDGKIAEDMDALKVKMKKRKEWFSAFSFSTSVKCVIGYN